MTGALLGAFKEFVVTALSATTGLVRDGKTGFVPAVVSGVLVPLMLPRIGAKLRRALTADGLRLRDPAQSQLTVPCWAVPVEALPEAVIGTDVLAELARKNARLARELSDLRAAYAELEADAATRAAVVDRLHHMAHHDPLTRLPNRTLLTDRLERSLAYARRAGSGVLVFYLDLDNFKNINDTLGHAAGDRVLVEVGSRISGCLRSADTASRIGGDEFVLVCATTDAAADAPRIKARLLTALSAPLVVDGTPVGTSASVGVSAFPADGADPAELIKKADCAMFSAKHAARR